jgi:predicted CopG family antitoxin
MVTITIKLRQDVHYRLKMYGNIGDTISDVIEDLLNYYEQREGKPQKKVKI